MKASFLKNIEKKKLFKRTDKLIIGMSGGKDSMAVAHLLLESGYTFSVAHCNFQLRGDEAKGDELFVKEYFEAKGVEVFTMRFETKKYAEQNNCSVQMAARELRYNWFNDLREKNKFNFNLTAHHANDNVETFFINLLRGSGLNGLKGIPEKTDTVVRPLLYATREEIDRYIQENKIPFREDSSNKEEKYLRNKLRHQLIPLLKEINPSLEQTMNREMSFLKQSHDLLVQTMTEKLGSALTVEKETTILDLKDIMESPYRELLIHEAIHKYDFNTDAVIQLNESISHGQSGKQFVSTTHRILLNRGTLVIRPLEEKQQQSNIEIQDGISEIQRPIHLTFKKQTGSVIKNGTKETSIDLEKLAFPLQLTKWQEGDHFHPLGMKGSKKVSDYFMDQKMSIFEKQEQWILRSGDKIVWIVGRRMDERFKVDEDTKNTLLIELK